MDKNGSLRIVLTEAEVVKRIVNEFLFLTRDADTNGSGFAAGVWRGVKQKLSRCAWMPTHI